MNIQPIEKKQMHEMIYEQLKSGILDGDFSPGEKLNQDELAQKLGVSRMPVRDALKLLVNDGLIENTIHRGFTVTEFSKETLEDVLYVRSIIEQEAVLQAKSNFTQARTLLLENILLKASAAVENENLYEARKLNAEFHFTIYETVESRILLELIQKLWHRVPNYAMYIKLETAVKSLETHNIILDCLKNGDFKNASIAMRNHIFPV